MNPSSIQWTTFTHNFWKGCKKVSDGCKFCYMYRMEDENGGDGNYIHRENDEYFNMPLKIKTPEKIFTCSMSDFFIEQADKWREKAWEIIARTPWHTWQILTKRPERIKQCLPKNWGAGYPNVWLGVTIENTKEMHRIDKLLQIPAKTYFISAEPLLEEVSFIKEGVNLLDEIDLIIIGGESGNDYGKYKYRPCEVAWMEKLTNKAKSNGRTKVFVKQMGTYLAKKGIGSIIRGNKAISNHGDDFDLFPESLKIRELPEVYTGKLF